MNEKVSCQNEIFLKLKDSKKENADNNDISIIFQIFFISAGLCVFPRFLRLGAQFSHCTVT